MMLYVLNEQTNECTQLRLLDPEVFEKAAEIAFRDWWRSGLVRDPGRIQACVSVAITFALRERTYDTEAIRSTEHWKYQLALLDYLGISDVEEGTRFDQLYALNDAHDMTTGPTWARDTLLGVAAKVQAANNAHLKELLKDILERLCDKPVYPTA